MMKMEKRKRQKIICLKREASVLIETKLAPQSQDLLACAKEKHTVCFVFIKKSREDCYKN